MINGLKSLLLNLFWALTTVGLLFFSVNNRQAVDLSFAPFDFVLPVPVFLVLFLGIFIGLCVAGSMSTYQRLQSFTKRRKAERHAAEMEKQVESLAEDAYKARTTDRQAHTTLPPMD